MSRRVGVFRRVFIRRSITTPRDATGLTGAQVYPLTTNLQAVFTFMTLRLLDDSNSFDMRTIFIGHDLIVFQIANRGNHTIGGFLSTTIGYCH
jgi:hypothetical protein